MTIRRILRSILDWATTIPTLIAFGLTLLFGDVAIRIARLFGLHPMEVTVGAVQRVLLWCFRLSGARIMVERHPEVERKSAYIFLSNHQSLLDVPIFGGILFSNYPKYIAKAELAKWIPLVSYNLKRGGNAIIDRASGTDAIRVIRSFGRVCQERGVSPVIFPEGTRSRDGRLQEFKSGGTAALLRAAPDMPIVPTAIDGSWKLLSHRLFPIPFGTRINVRFGAPILRKAGDNAQEVLDETRSRIADSLDAWRASAVQPNPGTT